MKRVHQSNKIKRFPLHVVAGGYKWLKFFSIFLKKCALVEKNIIQSLTSILTSPPPSLSVDSFGS